LSRPEATKPGPGAQPAKGFFPGDGEEPVFREPWEAQAFSMAVALHQRGLFTWKEWADTLATVIADPRWSALPYYEQWLVALERLATERALVDAAELARRKEAWRTAAARTPHGQPIVLPPDV
jgi:nitrile hydratase accessory protein